MRRAPTEGSQGWAVEAGSACQASTAVGGDAWLPARDDTDAKAAIQAAVAAERGRIASELHDSLNKNLLGIAMVTASLFSPQRPAEPHVLNKRLGELARLAHQAVSEAQRVINKLKDDALGEAVTCVATAWGIAAGARVSLAVAPAIEATEEIKREITAILFELLHNVGKHARCSRVQVCLRKVADGLLLSVTDDGTGFCPPADLRELQAAGSHGLIGIADRARHMGGALIIDSRLGRGTRISVRIPAPGAHGRQLYAVPPPPAARVIVAEGNPALRSGLCAVLGSAPDFEIVASAATAEEAVELVRQHAPDVLLLDVAMRPADGSAAISRLGELTQLVMLTCADDAGLTVRAVDATAHRYVVTGRFAPAELIQIVRDAARHRSALPAQAAAPAYSRNGDGNAIRHPFAELTPREREVMSLIADGLSNRQIAARLVISEKTVKNHICNIYQRIGVYGRSQAVSRWREL